MAHVILLGDSIFDNAAYVRGGPDVVTQLQARLPEGWRATLHAVDGAVTTSVRTQLGRLPGDSTHLALSVGGNDALGHMHLLSQPARSSAEVLERFASAADGFERNYRAMLDAVLGVGLPTVVCTIYYPSFPDRQLQRLSVTALTLFNDVILRHAFGAGLPVIDLRAICDSPEDYANPIEPSIHGGEKIAATILRVVQEHDFGSRQSAVFVRP